MTIKFTKMQAFGNDFVYVDSVGYRFGNPNNLATMICDRHFGVGADGLILIEDSDICDFRMRVFDPDGTEAEMCGNALRCAGKFVYMHGMTAKTDISIETIGGNQMVMLNVKNGEVTSIHAKIGAPIFAASQIPVISDEETYINKPTQVLDKIFNVSALSWGNPFAVCFVEDVMTFDVAKYGPALENHQIFPKRANITFAQVVDESHIKIREWERGIGETIGCATGCSTAVVFANVLKMAGRDVTVEQIGGDLHVIWDEDDNINMIGPAYAVFEGIFEYEEA